MVVCRKDGSHSASQSICPQMVESTHSVAIMMVREDWISTAKPAFRELSVQAKLPRPLPHQRRGRARIIVPPNFEAAEHKRGRALQVIGKAAAEAS